MKVALNRCFGGFRLSKEAIDYMGIDDDIAEDYVIGCSNRTNIELIKCIEKLGNLASGSCSDIRIIEIPDDVDWEIESYDGFETAVEKHRKW